MLIDDVGFGTPDTFGGFCHTPTLTKLRDEGICYKRFHTTSVCSPTRAALLTGRNHQRVGSGTIAERAVDWDGYTGVMRMTSATIAEVLGNYGYKTSAYGKWHNTPADQTSAMGPFTYWPSRRTSAAPAIRSSFHGQRKSKPTSSRARSSITSMTSPRRSTKSSASSRRNRSTVSNRIRWTG